MSRYLGWSLFAVGMLGMFASASRADEPATRIVLIAGNPSHGPGDHEHNAGVLLLANCLKAVPGVEPVVVKGGWPADERVFDGAKAVVLYMDGGGGHAVLQGDRLSTLGRLMDQGVGLVCIHYAVEVPKGEPGDRFQDWIGGFYETGWSTNPHWAADFRSFPDHPITRGVKPFSVRDEWYYNIRFRPEMKGVTPILVASPDVETRKGTSSSPRGPYPHVVAAAGRPEVLAWAVERPDGGRGFGFTGAHIHKNWGNEDFRKIVLNAIVWASRREVPSGGVSCKVSEEDLSRNLDPKGRPRGERR